MSHDRGCPCGKEKYEYHLCDKIDCINKWDIKMSNEWDFGFTSEEEIKLSVTEDNNQKVIELKNMILPLLNNLKKSPELDVIKWPGKQRIKQIEDFIEKMNKLVGE